MKFRPRFSLRTLFIVVTVIALFLWWQLYVRRDRQQLICDQFVATSLTGIHSKAMAQRNSDSVPGAMNFDSLIATMTNSFNPKTPCHGSFLLPNGKFRDGTLADDYEKQILADWSKVPTAGAIPPNENRIRNPYLGSFTYYKAIRADNNMCVTCHTVLNQVLGTSTVSSPPMTLGDIIAIAKVEVSN
jgi:hypothetical protein